VWVFGGGGAEQAAAALTCGDEQCLYEHFRTCTTGAVYTTQEVIGARVRYEIVVPPPAGKLSLPVCTQ
jgi:hypothetical protein